MKITAGKESPAKVLLKINRPQIGLFFAQKYEADTVYTSEFVQLSIKIKGTQSRHTPYL